MKISGQTFSVLCKLVCIWVIKDLGKGGRIHCLVVQKEAGGNFQLPAAAGKDVLTADVSLIHQLPHLLVNDSGNLDRKSVV